MICQFCTHVREEFAETAEFSLMFRRKFLIEESWWGKKNLEPYRSIKDV